MTALLSRVIEPGERGLYMGMQRTYGGISRIIAPLFCGWAFVPIGVSAPYFFSSAFILATSVLGFGLDKYARPKVAVAPEPISETAKQRNRIMTTQSLNAQLSGVTDLPANDNAYR